MIRYVIDASSVGPLVLHDEAQNAVAEVARGLARNECVVPAHWRFEVSNMLLVAVRRGRIDMTTATETLADLRDYSVEVDVQSLDQAWDRTFAIAEHHELTLYDAAYLELAERLGLILVTLDADLAVAAASRGVAVVGG